MTAHANDLPDAFTCMARENADAVATELRQLLSDFGLVKKMQNGSHELVGVAPELWQVLLLELAAVVQVDIWERQGLRGLVESLPPTAADCWDDVFQRFANCPSQFRALDGAQLFARVNEYFCQSLAWEAQHRLDATVALNVGNLDDVLDALAEVVWACRNDVREI